MFTAAVLRFWQLGDIPPGLYRDEAFNGLDALNVLDGQHPLYFAANNGREPVYIYLTAVTVYFLERSVLAVRLPAAIIGTLTTWFVYHLAKTWFGWRTGWLAAWLWAVTLWPVHLSRIGLRPILLPFGLALTFWLATLAYRRQRAGGPANWLWLLAGLAYGASFYTYLAVRFTPLLFLLLALYLGLTGRLKGLWPGLACFILAAAVVLTPLATFAWQQPELVLGRAGQVSILNPAIHQGDLLGTLRQHSWAALGLFLVQGDTILRHNPAGRPVFDVFMALPFVLGLVIAVRHWRHAPAAILLLWSLIMLGPTVLAEDTPHFLRAVGLLPAILFFPALGLSQLWTWTKLPSRLGPALVLFLVLGSLLVTVNDYFLGYGRQARTAYWFEAAARDLAGRLNAEPAGRAVLADRRFWDGWPSVRFLLSPQQAVTFYRAPGELPEQVGPPVSVYAWPYERLDKVVATFTGPALVDSQDGSLAQGDLETEAYPFFVRYTLDRPPEWAILANFGNAIQLRRAEISYPARQQIQVDLYWSTETGVAQPVVVFIHVLGPVGILGQSDGPPGQGRWPGPWWQPGFIVHDRHLVDLQEPFEATRHQVILGLYQADTRERLPVANAAGAPVGDTWLLTP